MEGVPGGRRSGAGGEEEGETGTAASAVLVRSAKCSHSVARDLICCSTTKGFTTKRKVHTTMVGGGGSFTRRGISREEGKTSPEGRRRATDSFAPSHRRPLSHRYEQDRKLTQRLQTFWFQKERLRAQVVDETGEQRKRKGEGIASARGRRKEEKKGNS